VANEKPLDISHEAFLGVCRFLLTRATEALVKAETLRLLLVQRGVFSEAEFDEMEIYVRKQWESTTAQAVSEAQALANDVALRQLFESPKLPQQ
jgi:hypothetical protein